MQGNMMLSLIAPNERHKRLRKLVAAQLRPTAITEYFHPVQKVEIHRLVNNLIENPRDWRSHNAQAIASIVSHLFAGEVTVGVDERFIKDHDDYVQSPH